MQKIIRLIIFFSWLTTACGRGDDANRKQNAKYFDISGLAREQMNVLPRAGLYLSKTASVDMDTSRTVTLPDSAQWLLEFQNLTDADINKPRLKDNYRKRISRQEKTVTITEYSSLQPDKTHVDTLVIIEKPGELTICAKIRDKNALFTAAKSLNYHFRLNDGIFLLSTYHITGWQKMIALDSVHYSICANIVKKHLL